METRMHGRYKKTVLRLTSMQRKLELQPADLKLLLSLQRELVRLIRGTEQRVAGIRPDIAADKRLLRNGQLTKEQSKRLKKRMTSQQGRIENEQFLSFIWKCFGTESRTSTSTSSR